MPSKLLLCFLILILQACSQQEASLTEKEARVVEKPIEIRTMSSSEAIQKVTSSIDKKSVAAVLSLHRPGFNWSAFWFELTHRLSELDHKKLSNLTPLLRPTCESGGAQSLSEFLLAVRILENKSQSFKLLSHAVTECSDKLGPKLYTTLKQQLYSLIINDLDSKGYDAYLELLLVLKNRAHSVENLHLDEIIGESQAKDMIKRSLHNGDENALLRSLSLSSQFLSDYSMMRVISDGLKSAPNIDISEKAQAFSLQSLTTYGHYLPKNVYATTLFKKIQRSTEVIDKGTSIDSINMIYYALNRFFEMNQKSQSIVRVLESLDKLIDSIEKNFDLNRITDNNDPINPFWLYVLTLNSIENRSEIRSDGTKLDLLHFDLTDFLVQESKESSNVVCDAFAELGLLTTVHHQGELRLGCNKLNLKKLKFQGDLTLSHYQLLMTNGEDLRIYANSLKNGMFDLSAPTQTEIRYQITENDIYRPRFPVILGKPLRNRVYLYCHAPEEYVIKESFLTRVTPKDGQNGGDLELYLESQASQKIIFVSEASAGQYRPAVTQSLPGYAKKIMISPRHRLRVKNISFGALSAFKSMLKYNQRVELLEDSTALTRYHSLYSANLEGEKESFLEQMKTYHWWLNQHYGQEFKGKKGLRSFWKVQELEALALLVSLQNKPNNDNFDQNCTFNSLEITMEEDRGMPGVDGRLIQ